MEKIENQNVEFKREYTDGIKKEVVAFVNSEGGSILVGVEDDGTPCGLEKPNEVMTRISNSLKDSISPDVMPFVEIKAKETEGKSIIEIAVSAGVNRPYYLREKGLKPSGVYVRKGSSSQPVSDEAIRQMIVHSAGKSFEECRSLQQDLTFESLQTALRKRDIELGSAQMQTLKLVGDDGLYTNLALILSDQCPFSTKTAIFQGNEKIVFRDRAEFHGSIIQQMDEVYHYIDLCNKTKAVFKDLDRFDIRDYPEEAVREAWLNCIVHRDYSFSGSTIVNIYDDKIEFVSLGGLVPGLSLESIFMGVSQSRNPNLAALFYRMRLIEGYGTGIGKIRHSYKNTGLEAVFETAPGVFRVTLPNCNEPQENSESHTVGNVKTHGDGEEEKLVLEYAGKRGRITRKETEELLQIGSTKAFRILKKLCEDGRLKVAGSGRFAAYVPSGK